MCLTEEGFNDRMAELKKAVDEFKKEHAVEQVKVIFTSTALHFMLTKVDQNEEEYPLRYQIM
jgi:hypothetical protein